MLLLLQETLRKQIIEMVLATVGMNGGAGGSASWARTHGLPLLGIRIL